MDSLAERTSSHVHVELEKGLGEGRLEFSLLEFGLFCEHLWQIFTSVFRHLVACVCGVRVEE